MFDFLVQEIMKREAEMIEHACYEMHLRGFGGVKITRSWSKGTVTIRLDDDIPYGEIHEIREE